MSILAGFLPFAAFAILDQVAATALALAAAAGVAAIAVVRDLARRRALKLLDLGALAMFGVLAIVTLVAGGDPSVLAVRARVDGGLLAIVALSIAVGRPFTVDYAKEQVPEAVWGQPAFHRINVQISLAWAGAFAAMLAADLAMLYAAAPLALGVAVTVGALAAAAIVTTVVQRRARAAKAAA